MLLIEQLDSEIFVLDFCRQHDFRSVYQRERGLTCCSTWSRAQPLENCAEFLHPLPHIRLEPVEDPWLDSLKKHAISSFHLTIALGVGDRGIMNPNALGVTEFSEFPCCKLCFVVGDNGIHHSKALSYICDELDCLACCDGSDWVGLDPLGEFVDGYKHVRKASLGWFKWSYHVEPPDRKGPRHWYGLQLSGWNMLLSCKKLASLTFTYQGLGVGEGSWPVETLTVNLSYKCSRSCVVST